MLEQQLKSLVVTLHIACGQFLIGHVCKISHVLSQFDEVEV